MIVATATSSSAVTVAVEKATSDLLISPDWTMNIDICDSVNSHQWYSYIRFSKLLNFFVLVFWLTLEISVLLMIISLIMLSAA